MAIKDQKNDIKVLGTIAPQAASGNITGTVVAVAGFESVTLYGHGDATAIGTLKIQESATSGGTYTAVAAADIIGSAPTIDGAADDDQAYKFGYAGGLRFIKVVSTIGTTTTGAIYGALVIPGHKINQGKLSS